MAAKRFNIDTEELWDCKGIPRPIRFPYSKYRALAGNLVMTSNRLEMTGKFFIGNQNKIVRQKVD